LHFNIVYVIIDLLSQNMRGSYHGKRTYYSNGIAYESGADAGHTAEKANGSNGSRNNAASASAKQTSGASS